MMDLHDELERLLSEVEDIGMPERGDLLQGRVLSVDEGGLVVDLGLKRDGVVHRTDLDKLPSSEAELKVGDLVTVMVIAPVDEEGNLLVSISQARESGDWLAAQRLMEGEEILEAVTCGHNRGGLIVPFGRLKGFVPASHISEVPRGLDEASRLECLQGMVGQKMPFKVIEVDPQRRRLVFSERRAIRQWRQDQKARVIETLNEGDIREGEVTSLREFGAFVDIGGADGLVHISELSWRRVEDPSEVVSVGEVVKTLVIRLDRDANRIGLSFKRLQPNPWQAAVGRVRLGTVVPGVVSRFSAAGVYVRLEEDLEGLLHMPDGPGGLTRGDQISVRVTAFDAHHERLELAWAEGGASTLNDVGV